MHNSYLYSSLTWKCHLIITIILFKNVLSFCPSKCKCTSELNSRTSCINADLEVVPIQLNPDTKYINLTLNKIRNVDFTLPFYTKLEILDLSHNLIETLGSKNFEFQKILRTLNLSHNDVIQLSKDAFKGLGNLLLLDLSYNRIELIHTTSMLDLTSLIELDLSNNYIISIDDGIFKNMISLEILLLKNNQLLDVPANNLEYLKSLKSIDLSDNLIENIKNESFNDLKELIMLSLSGNVISDLNLGAFDGLVGLKSMDIADNNLTVVPTQQLSKLSNLTYLSLSGNRFTHIPAVSLLNLFHLKELHLERLDHLLKIDSRAFIDNTHLQKIYLNNNQNFSDLPMRLFHGNPNLIEISMQGNNLKTIDAAQFPIDRIQRLYLGDNPLECNCSLLWLWRLVTSGNTDDKYYHKPTTSSAHYQRYYHQNSDDPEYNDIDHNKNSDIKNTLEKKSETLLILDSERIGCDIITSSNDHIKIRKLLRNMDENEITCPAHIVTIVCAILSSFVVIMTGASILFYLRIIKKRRKLLNERRNGKTTILNVHDRIIQQQLNTNTFNHHHNNHHNYHINHHLHNSTNFNNHLNLQNHHLTAGTGTTGTNTGTGTGTTNSNQSSIVDDKLELERYLTAQAIANEYRALKPWEITTIKDTKDTTNDYDLQTPSDENHYEKFDHYDYPDTRQLSKPHVVYV